MTILTADLTADLTAAMVYISLICQIFTISIYLANKWHKNRARLLIKYPSDDYPNLYVVSAQVELSRIKFRQRFDGVIALFSGLVVAYFYLNNADIQLVSSTIIIIAAIQLVPWFLSSYWCQGNNKLMAENFPSTKRKSSFITRKITDFVKPSRLIIALISYSLSVGFCLYIFIEKLWQAQSSNVLLLILLSTAMVAYLVWLALNSLYGKKKDNFISSEDRIDIIAAKCRAAILFITLYSCFIIGICLIKTYDLNEVYVEVLTSLFIQLLLILSFSNNSEKNYQVYK
ncbi:MAG: hypothetical protein JKY81_09175 [Colwellia sp.]|nr:hypothetical protein [Colwellia sp.]